MYNYKIKTFIQIPTIGKTTVSSIIIGTLI